jgi:hypothetical protein
MSPSVTQPMIRELASSAKRIPMRFEFSWRNASSILAVAGMHAVLSFAMKTSILGERTATRHLAT